MSEMSDRELLELAAKAAGLDINKTNVGGVERLYINGELDEWNPITDDGDALRLAVDLGIDVLVTNTGIESGVTTTFPSLENSSRIEVEHGQSPYAATRRAIVRAAAEIGMGMTQKVPSVDLPEDNYYKSLAEAEELGRSKT
jgi:hypothetical protein